jgi:hypothetical protein
MAWVVKKLSLREGRHKIQDMDYWRALVNTAELLSFIKSGKFFE